MRYIVKKTKVPGRGGGPSVEAWNVEDTATGKIVVRECTIKSEAERIRDGHETYHKLYGNKLAQVLK